MISYATSKDRVTWDKPMLGVVPWQGERSNLLLGLLDDHECSYANAFFDPKAANKSRMREMLALMSTKFKSIQQKPEHTDVPW